MSSNRKQDQAAARRANRSAIAKPYARPTKKPVQNDGGIPSSSSFSGLFSFLTAPFRKKEPETRPPLSDRDSAAEVSGMLVDDDDEDEASFSEPEPEAEEPGPTPAVALSLRGRQMQQSMPTPVVARPFVPVPKNDPRRTSGYVPKPAPVAPIFLDPQAPFNPPLPFPSGSPSPEPPSVPTVQVHQALEHVNVSPEKLDLVTSFLNEKRASGTPLSEIEAAGIVKLIQDSVNEGVRPLAATPSKSFAMSLGLSAPTTPIRSSKSEGSVGGSRMTPSYTLPAFPPPDTPLSGEPIQKREVKNPNPPLVYRGAGRSSRSRTPAKTGSRASASPVPSPPPTRYRSAAFGSPAKETPPTLLLTDSDSKRRKANDGTTVTNPSTVGDVFSTSAFGSPSSSSLTNGRSNGINTSSSSTNGFSAPSSSSLTTTPSTPVTSSLGRSRPAFGIGSLNATVPSKPSPLRQSMRPDSPQSSPPGAPNKSATTTPTKPSTSKTFEVMQEVIANNKKPDPLPEVTNPYQSGSPFRATRRQPQRKTPVKAAAPPAIESPPPLPPAKKEMTALELIEKSAPKNLKRSSASNSMPPPAATPAKASRPKSPSPPRIPGSGAPFVRSSFAPSPSQSMVSATRKTASYFVPDDDEEEMEIEVVEEPKAKKRKPSPPAPVVDEVIELDEEPKSALPAATPVNAKKNFPGMRDPYRSKEPSPLRQSFQPDSPPEFDTGKTSTTPAGSPKARAKQLPEAALPTFVFAALSSSTADPFASTSTDVTKEKALRAPLSDLPTFALDSTPAPAPTAAKASFDWSAAGMKPPAPKAGGAWICKECSLENPKDATEKCKFCDTKRPADAQLKGAAPAPAFNWAAAGFKMPEAPKGGAWKCGTCFCDNKAGATKCEVCDAPKS